MVIVGWWSSAKSPHSNSDYLLAGRSIGPWSVGLSALATSLSGFMFIGYIGYAYTHGVSALWYLLTWALGDLIAWFTVHKRLREKSGERNLNTVTAFVSSDGKRHYNWISKLAGLVTVIFLMVYAAAQLKVSSKALNAIVGWDYSWGVIIAAAIVYLYCYAGGVRSSIATNVVQAVLMCISMQVLCIVSIYQCGGLASLSARLAEINPILVSFAPQDTVAGFVIFLASLMINGYGVIGQPHIMTRPMTLANPSDMNCARNVYFGGYLILGLGALGVGLTARVLMPEIINADPELALPFLSMKLLPGFLVGLMLAGVFAAALSTADSQILSCSANLTQDLIPKWGSSVLVSRICTLVFTILASLIALASKQNVFDLVLVAWSVLAVSIGVLVFLRCFDIYIGEKTALLMMLGSITTVMLWRYVLVLNEVVHEALPGLFVALVIFFAGRFVSKR